MLSYNALLREKRVIRSIYGNSKAGIRPCGAGSGVSGAGSDADDAGSGAFGAGYGADGAGSGPFGASPGASGAGPRLGGACFGANGAGSRVSGAGPRGKRRRSQRQTAQVPKQGRNLRRISALHAVLLARVPGLKLNLHHPGRDLRHLWRDLRRPLRDLRRKRTYFCMAASTSSGLAGRRREPRRRAPSAVMRTSSSMRMPPKS